jgi:hypothetical protein
MTINGTSGLVFNDASTQNTSAFLGGLAFRNRIINGAMMIDQRNAGASVTSTTSNPYTVDRWQSVATVSSKYTIQQSSVAPTGFVNSLLITSSAATTVGSGDVYCFGQKIEGLNVADLGWGAAGASTITISFWVRSSLTGTFGGSVANNAFDRSYPFTYTISAANTWEQKTVTIAGDTTGTWLKTSGIGLVLWLGLGVGSGASGTGGAWSGTGTYSATGATSVVGTNGATFYITGVQLEKGSTATSFDYRPYGTELALCQRYFWKSVVSASNTYLCVGQCQTSSSVFGGTINLPVTMRTIPTTAVSSLSDFKAFLSNGSASSTAFNAGSFSSLTAYKISQDMDGATGLTAGNASVILLAGNGWVSASAEL